jgi:hypothetical protein
MACRCGYAAVSEPTRVDSVCLQCGRLIDSKKWDGATSSEIDSGAGPHLISSTSLSRGHSKYEWDDDGGPDETMTAKSEDPPGLVCKIIVLMCGIATFARTECILLQTVLFAECELPLFFVRSCACAHVISRGCVRCPGTHERHACAVPHTAIAKWTHALNPILLVLALTWRHARIVAYFSHSEHVRGARVLLSARLFLYNCLRELNAYCNIVVVGVAHCPCCVQVGTTVQHGSIPWHRPFCSSLDRW